MQVQVETYLYVFSVKILIKRSECAFIISKINVCFSRDSLSHPFVSKSEIPTRKDQIIQKRATNAKVYNQRSIPKPYCVTDKYSQV
jgi:hypothetical protein